MKREHTESFKKLNMKTQEEINIGIYNMYGTMDDPIKKETKFQKIWYFLSEDPSGFYIDYYYGISTDFISSMFFISIISLSIYYFTR